MGTNRRTILHEIWSVVIRASVSPFLNCGLNIQPEETHFLWGPYDPSFSTIIRPHVEFSNELIS